jgi:Uma2 family endonuclease
VRVQLPSTKTTIFTAIVSTFAVNLASGGTVEKIIGEQILEALKSGDHTRIAAYVLVFFFIWLEVRGLKKEVAKLNATVAKSFSEGETRFLAIEGRLSFLEHVKSSGGMQHETISTV